MSLSKYIDSLYGELSLKETGEDAGMNDEMLRSKPFKTRLRIQLARAAVLASPEGVEWLLTRPYTRRGYEVVGYGFQSTVLRTGNEVIKVMRRSTYEDDEWRRAKVEDLTSRQRTAMAYIGEYLIPQEFNIEDHPVYEGKATIISRQRYVDYAEYPLEKMFADCQHPDTSYYLRDFSLAALAMLNREQLIPDILGTNNIVSYESKPMLLDTVPMTRSDNPNAFIKIADILEEIASIYTKSTDQSQP